MKQKFCRYLLCGLFLLSTPVWAQLNTDSRAIYDRMDRLERDITLLQRRLYKNDDSTPKTQTPAIHSDIPEGSVQHLYAKIADLEQLVAQMTGQFEELSYQVAQTQADLKKINADIDLRLSEIQEQKNNTPATAEPLPVQQKEKPKDAKSAYNAAYDLLKQLKYSEAEVALKEFLATYPNDELAGNAQYWLGETYYVRHQYEQAAVAFANGFKNYKKSSKAPDNLLKLGLSMQQLDKKKEACTAFKSLKKEFPKASELILSRAQKESKKLGCDK